MGGEKLGATTSADKDLYYNYFVLSDEFVMDKVPENDLGFEPGEVHIKKIQTRDISTYDAEMKMRYINGEFEWVAVTMTVMDEDTISLMCIECDNEILMERI